MTDGFKCVYCNRIYKNVKEKDECTRSHDLIYVPMTKEDLNRLINFIMTGEQSLLTKQLVENLFHYQRK